MISKTNATVTLSHTDPSFRANTEGLIVSNFSRKFVQNWELISVLKMPKEFDSRMAANNGCLMEWQSRLVLTTPCLKWFVNPMVFQNGLVPKLESRFQDDFE